MVLRPIQLHMGFMSVMNTSMQTDDESREASADHPGEDEASSKVVAVLKEERGMQGRHAH